MYWTKAESGRCATKCLFICSLYPRGGRKGSAIQFPDSLRLGPSPFASFTSFSSWVLSLQPLGRDYSIIVEGSGKPD